MSPLKSFFVHLIAFAILTLIPFGFFVILLYVAFRIFKSLGIFLFNYFKRVS
jgi:hypothetical protein